MTRIQSRTTAAPAPAKPQAAAAKASTPAHPQAKTTGWAPKAGGVSAAGKAKPALPMPASTADALQAQAAKFDAMKAP
jgi:hypothetical protein